MHSDLVKWLRFNDYYWHSYSFLSLLSKISSIYVYSKTSDICLLLILFAYQVVNTSILYNFWFQIKRQNETKTKILYRTTFFKLKKKNMGTIFIFLLCSFITLIFLAIVCNMQFIRILFFWYFFFFGEKEFVGGEEEI